MLDAAASLGYTGPDPRAASLRRGRSGIVAVVVGSSLNFMFLDPVQRLLMDGLAEAVAPLGAGLLPMTPISAFRPRRWRGDSGTRAASGWVSGR